MHHFFAGLFPAAFLPFIPGFAEVPPPDLISSRSPFINPVSSLRASFFCPPMANPREPRTHVTYLRLNLLIVSPSHRPGAGIVTAGSHFVK